MLLAACGGGSSDPASEPVASGSANIGTSGGALALEGLALTLPPRAVTQSANLSISSLAAGAGEIARFRLSPAGMVLSVPSELRFARAGLPAKTSFFWEVGGELRLVPGTLVGDVLTAKISSLGLSASGDVVLVQDTPPTRLAKAVRLLATAPAEGGTVVVKPMDCAKDVANAAARLKVVAAGHDQELVIRFHDELEAVKQLCLETEVQALKDSSCEALSIAEFNAQSVLANSFTTFQELTLPLFAAESFVQMTGAICPTADSSRVGPLVADKFEQFLQVLQSQQLRGGFAEEATARDIKVLLSFKGSCDQLDLGAICDRLNDEIFPNLLDGLRRGAFEECRNGSPLVVSQLHFLGTSVTDETRFLGFGRFSLADVEADLMYCTNPFIDVRVFANATDEITDRATTLRPLVAQGNYVRSATVAVPREGALVVSGEATVLRCADGSASTADLVARIGTTEVARRRANGNSYPLSAPPLDLLISRVLASAGLDTATTNAFTIAVKREGGQCLGALGPTLTGNFPLFEIRVNLPTVLTAPPDNLRQTVNLAAQLTGPTPFTVVAETRTASGAFAPIPGARVTIDAMSGGSLCATMDRVSALTNANGVATFTVSPTPSCLQLNFFVQTTFGPTLLALQQMSPAVVFPVFVGDLDLVFAGALPLAAHLEEVTGRLRISSVVGTESFTSVNLPKLKRVGRQLEVGQAVSVQLPVLESVLSLSVTGSALSRLTRFEAPALKQAFAIDIRDNPALRTLAIGPVKVQTNFNIFKNGFQNFDQFSPGIDVGQNLQIFDNTGFSNQTAQDFVNRLTLSNGALAGVGRNTGP